MSEPIGLIERAASLLREQAQASRPEAATPGAVDVKDAALIGSTLDIGRLARHGIKMPSAGRSRSVEEFRLIKRNLMNGWLQEDVGPDQPSTHLIMVTSARPEEGKSFVAINLALGFACEAEVRALLVDLDTNHPLLPSFFGVPEGRGIADVLAGSSELSDVLVPTNLPTLAILPSGQGQPHLPELLSSKRMPALLGDLASRFRGGVIIIDTPPCLASSDAVTLAPLVDQIIFVVEAHRTQQGEIESALLQLSGCTNISLLLNKCDGSIDHFGSYGYNYYQEQPDRIRDAQPTDDKSHIR